MGEPNELMASCLDELGWSPRTLARQINRVYRDGTVAETTPYHWRDGGAVPRPPVSTLAALVLARELGRRITPEMLWGERGRNSPLVQLASVGLEDVWSIENTMRLTDDLVRGGLIDRRFFLAVSGSALEQAVCAYLAGDDLISMLPRREPVGDSLIEQIEDSVPMLQALDDAHGGAAHLGYVGAQVRAVALVLREGGYTGEARRRLLRALADLAQLAGWKSFDAVEHGLAQRYYFTALRAAHAAGYQTMAAHTLADLAVQAVARSEEEDAVSLGEAAARHATATPAGVHACVLSRLAHAYAAKGLIAEFERTADAALAVLGDRNADDDPAWLYYLTPTHLDCQAGYSYVLAGRRARAGDKRRSRALLRRGEELLSRGAFQVSLHDPSQRRALYEGSWLALGYVANGKLDRSAAVAEVAVRRLDTVRSPRSAALLRRLEREYSRRRRNADIDRVLPELQAALLKQPA